MEEQIEALIRHRAYDLVMECAPSKKISDAKAYAEVFTVKRTEVLDYLVRNYRLGDLVPTQPSNRDGFYALPDRRGFRIYEQYDGLKTTEEFVPNELSVWKRFVDYILRTSLTGLDFN